MSSSRVSAGTVCVDRIFECAMAPMKPVLMMTGRTP